MLVGCIHPPLPLRTMVLQIAACEEEVDRLAASKAAAQAEAEEADAAAQQALETGHAEVLGGRRCGRQCLSTATAPLPWPQHTHTHAIARTSSSGMAALSTG